MHHIQKILLYRLLQRNNQPFAVLTRGYDFDDNIVFHLKQLAQKGLITKTGSHYAITAEGVKAITHYDLSELDDTGFKTFFVGLVCHIDDGYLLKEHAGADGPFYNLPSGKPRFGEPIESALPRLFAELTGLNLPPSAFTFRSLHLKTVVTSDGEPLFDDAFTVYDVAGPTDPAVLQLAPNIQLLPVADIAKLPNRWPEIDRCILHPNLSVYQVYTVASNYILE